MKVILKSAQKLILVSSKLKRLKTILEYNPKLILAVAPVSRFVLIKIGDNLKFDKQEWKTAYRLIQEEIITRPDPKDRIEKWEYYNPNLPKLYDHDLKQKLLKRREKMIIKRIKPVIDQRALNEFCDYFKVDRIFGKSFLAEIKLSTDSNHKKHREIAKTLKLIC